MFTAPTRTHELGRANGAQQFVVAIHVDQRSFSNVPSVMGRNPEGKMSPFAPTKMIPSRHELRRLARAPAPN